MMVQELPVFFATLQIPIPLRIIMLIRLTKDRQGNIWIGTFGGFMNRYNRVSGKIKRIEPGIQKPGPVCCYENKTFV